MINCHQHLVPVFVCGLFFFWNFNPATAQINPLVEEQEQTKHLASLMAGLEDQRGLLKSGRFKIDCQIEYEKNERRGLSGTIYFKAECFFAEQFKKFRFDQSVSQVTINHRQQNEKMTLTSESKYVLSPDYSIHTEGNNTSVRIFDPNRKPYGYFSPFDIRVVGMINDTEQLRGMARSGQRWFLPGVLDHYRGYTLDEINQIDNDLYEVSWLYGKNNELKQVLWIDAAKGFSPTKMLLFIKRGNPKTFHNFPAVETVVTWAEKQDVWVPVKLVTNNQLNPSHIEMKFEWLTINKKVPDKVFTVDGFTLPMGRWVTDDNGKKGMIETSIIDHRAGKKRIIKGGGFLPDPLNIEK